MTTASKKKRNAPKWNSYAGNCGRFRPCHLDAKLVDLIVGFSRFFFRLQIWEPWENTQIPQICSQVGWFLRIQTSTQQASDTATCATLCSKASFSRLRLFTLRKVNLWRSWVVYNIPSGKRLHSYRKSPFLIGKPSISIRAIFNSYHIYIYSWLVVYLPLWKIWKSVGMMTFPIYMEK